MWIRLWLMAVMLMMGLASAEESPSWAVRAAVDKLLSPHVLMLPGGDWFATSDARKSTDHFSLPKKQFSRAGDGWLVEITSPCFRTFETGQWGEWKSPPKSGQQGWRLATIRVTQQAGGGVAAAWVSGDRIFEPRRAPSVIDARRLLASGAYTTPPEPPGAVPAPKTTPPLTPEKPSAGPAPSAFPAADRGIFKKDKDGKLVKVQ
ncbi:hypothetical protein [Luteolibacter sp. LG18]|uniref:hypothetical protein n=1 Tax=Luteolibacter sp. LG18 TaxID=2819286 RepID=UPI002B2D45EF|nr:hypothetical protein llg_36000 [Luteolibacter sp. LG18]